MMAGLTGDELWHQSGWNDALNAVLRELENFDGDRDELIVMIRCLEDTCG